MADFKAGFAFVLQHEDSTRSGKVTVDAGGRTRFGIAEKFHPDLPEKFFTGLADDALTEAEKIEEHEYWEAMRLDEVKDQKVANKLFDMAVNMGVRQAALYAQRAANALVAVNARVAEDGAIGPKTLAAINAGDPMAFHQLRLERGALSASGCGKSGAGSESERMDEEGGGVSSPGIWSHSPILLSIAMYQGLKPDHF